MDLVSFLLFVFIYKQENVRLKKEGKFWFKQCAQIFVFILIFND